MLLNVSLKGIQERSFEMVCNSVWGLSIALLLSITSNQAKLYLSPAVVFEPALHKQTAPARTSLVHLSKQQI